MTLPQTLLQSLQNVPGFDERSFVAVHQNGKQVNSIRFNPAKIIMNHEQDTNNSDSLNNNSPLLTDDSRLTTKIPWSSYGYYLSERPSFTFDPLFHAGTYYVQEASSMFLEQALRQTVDLSKTLRVLDLCAAPGGKSTLIQSLINAESLLVSNEVIKSRAAVLEENITKWGAANVVVTNNDPMHFARLENYFDVIVIDAPCSGSGLFRKDPEAMNEWSENNVTLCSQRQQRIIADAWPALKQDGVLIYSTCSYSKEENENISDWICEELKAGSMSLKIKEEWRIVETISAKNKAAGYRFYPDKVNGEGFFIAAFKKNDGSVFAENKPNKDKAEKLSKEEERIVKKWLKDDANIFLFKQKDEIIALPAILHKEIPVLQSALYIKKAGVTAGKLAGKDFIPDHALALSNIINKNIEGIELNINQAIQYLRREEMQLDLKYKGWAIVSYMGHHLGWIKILANRFNNYYPKEWRIIKQNS